MSLMICPNKKCNRRCIGKHKHYEGLLCNRHHMPKRNTCPACIPVEPEPTCLHTWSWAEGQTHEVCSKCGEIGEQVVDNAKVEIAAILRKYDCLMIPVKDKQLKEQLLAVLRTPADLKPAEPQAEMMPLIEHPMSGDMQYDLAFTIGRNSQQASDMAWLPAHDQQVRKAFAEVVSICNQLIALVEHGDYSNGNVAQGIDEGASMAMRRLTELKAELAHIRAMAEGGS